MVPIERLLPDNARARRLLRDEQDTHILRALHKDNYPLRAMMVKLGCGYPRLQRLLREAGLEVQPCDSAKRYRRKIDGYALEHGVTVLTMIERFREEGRGHLSAANALGITSRTLRNYCRDAGIPLLGRGSSAFHNAGKNGLSKFALEQSARVREKWVTWGGERLTVKQWAARLGMSVPRLHYRLAKWPLENAMTDTPPSWARGSK